MEYFWTAVVGVSTVALVLVTAANVWLVRRYTESTERMVGEMRATREAQERAAEEDLDRLLGRVRSNLMRIHGMSGRLRDRSPEAPLPADVGDELEVLWNTYYRVSGPIFSLGDDGLSERVDDFFQRVRKAGFLIRDIEEKSKPGDARAMREERRVQLEAVLGLGAEVVGLLRELAGLDPAALVRRRGWRARL